MQEQPCDCCVLSLGGGEKRCNSEGAKASGCLHAHQGPCVACMLLLDVFLKSNVCFRKNTHQLPCPPQNFGTPDAPAAAIPVDSLCRGVARDCFGEGDEDRSINPWVPSRGEGVEEHHVGQRATATAWQVVPRVVPRTHTFPDKSCRIDLVYLVGSYEQYHDRPMHLRNGHSERIRMESCSAFVISCSNHPRRSWECDICFHTP